MTAIVTAIEYHLPAHVEDNQALVAAFPDWSMEKIESKTGIRARHIAAAGEFSSDLGVTAAEKLFDSGACVREEIDYVLFCTQSPDYLLPTTACLIQDRLGLRKSIGALDFNLGCSGFVYGLGLAKGLIETGQAKKVLLITAETYSKFLHCGDRSVRTLFGDGAAATLIETSAGSPAIGPFVYGSDGSGAGLLRLKTGGVRYPNVLSQSEPEVDDFGNVRSDSHLYMNGPEIFSFAMEAVPQSVAQLMAAASLAEEDVDLFVFHQANRYMLECLQRKLRLPAKKFFIHLESCGNTVSSTIPIALKEAASCGALQNGQVAMLVGFGVGLSWGATVIRWGV